MSNGNGEPIFEMPFEGEFSPGVEFGVFAPGQFAEEQAGFFDFLPEEVVASTPEEALFAGNTAEERRELAIAQSFEAEAEVEAASPVRAGAESLELAAAAAGAVGRGIGRLRALPTLVGDIFTKGPRAAAARDAALRAGLPAPAFGASKTGGGKVSNGQKSGPDVWREILGSGREFVTTAIQKFGAAGVGGGGAQAGMMVRKSWRTPTGVTVQVGKRTFIYTDNQGFSKKYTIPAVTVVNLRNPRLSDLSKADKVVRKGVAILARNRTIRHKAHAHVGGHRRRK